MKTSIVLSTLGAAVALAQVESLGCFVSSSIAFASSSSLTDQIVKNPCINGVVSYAKAHGCATGGWACYCGQQSFGFGVRDCSNEACGGADKANSVISYAASSCSGM